MAKLSFPKFIKDSGLLILIVLLLSGFAKEESIEQNDSDTQKQIFYQTIILNGKDVVQQFVITEDVYQYSQTSNLSDIKIIDADDNPLPLKERTGSHEQSYTDISCSASTAEAPSPTLCILTGIGFQFTRYSQRQIHLKPLH